MAGDPVWTSSPWHSWSISWIPAYISFMAVWVADGAGAVVAEAGGMLVLVDDAFEAGELSHVAVMGRCI